MLTTKAIKWGSKLNPFKELHWRENERPLPVSFYTKPIPFTVAPSHLKTVRMRWVIPWLTEQFSRRFFSNFFVHTVFFFFQVLFHVSRLNGSWHKSLSLWPAANSHRAQTSCEPFEHTQTRKLSLMQVSMATEKRMRVTTCGRPFKTNWQHF